MSASVSNAADVAQKRSLDVLVAEDNLLNQKVMAAFLEHLGHRSVIVNDGAEALRLLVNNSFQVALIDIQLPKMNGIELVERLRQLQRNDDRSLPRLVALTAMARPDGHDFYTGRGFDAYLSKPLNLASLEGELARVERGTQ